MSKAKSLVSPALRKRLGLRFKVDSKVDHPKHYNAHPSGVEAIVVIEHMTFNVGSAIKYLWRAGLKDGEPTVQDLKKAAWYIAREIARIEAGPKNVRGGAPAILPRRPQSE